jgi:hypothetical protein
MPVAIQVPVNPPFSDDCQSQSQPFLPVALAISQLLKFTENIFKLRRWDTDATVPDFQAQSGLAFSAQDHHTAMMRVADCIRYQISESINAGSE